MKRDPGSPNFAEAKLVYLLKCLQKTPPPVLIFCENKSDVDDVHEYLLLKGQLLRTERPGSQGQKNMVAQMFFQDSLVCGFEASLVRCDAKVWRLWQSTEA